MKEKTIKKLVGIAMILCAVAGVLSLVMFIPQVREFIIGLGEQMVCRPLTHMVWHERLIKWELLFLALVTLTFQFLKLVSFASLQSTSIYALFQSKLQKLSDDDRAHYVALAAFVFGLCVLHFCMVPSNDDVNYFNHALRDTSYFDFLKLRYNSWSSRLFIETALINCYALNFGVWRFFDVVAFAVIAESIVYICVPQKRLSIFVYAVILLITDWNSLRSAGWGATTVNYVWPLAASMPMFVVFKKMFDGTAVSKKENAFSLLLLFFAANQEQVAAWLFGLSLSFLIYRIIKNRRVVKDDLFVIASVLICLLSLAFIVTCPGNYVRFESEIGTWFSQYASLSFFEKVQQGILQIFTYYFSLRHNLVIVPLCIILTLALRLRNRRLFFLQIVMNSFVALNFVLWVLMKDKYLLANNKLYQFSDFSKVAVMCECAVLSIAGVVLLCQIATAFTTMFRGLCNVFILIAGFCSAFIISFSPTVYASGSRCYLFLSYTIFFVASNMMSDCCLSMRENRKLRQNTR